LEKRHYGSVAELVYPRKVGTDGDRRLLANITANVISE
jgi:hypothetical protein